MRNHFSRRGADRAGMEPVAVAIEAARQRFRPIVMTSLPFILGCIPLALASGAGANSQHAIGIGIGIGIIGGMLASTLVVFLFVPLFFVLMEAASQRVRALGDAGARPTLPVDVDIGGRDLGAR